MTSPSSSPNRLASETSPYLLQHSRNPVDWFPWGQEAFDRARSLDRPVFLSIGYSSCHWCHVMERESFENPSIAAFLNAHFVSIKVDREERPDVDDVYMAAVQAISGRGGWPLSAFLLPDKRPFFAGTYFPPEDQGGRLGFRSLLARLAAAWREDRRGLEETADRIVEEIETANRLPERVGQKPLEPSLSDFLSQSLKRAFDARHGGFSGAPKFPPHQALEWLLRRGADGDPTSLSMAFATLDAMALGGIHDHVGGGFHRYSTDPYWLVPHFEKMLYDNAQLLASFSRAASRSRSSLHRRTAVAIADYLLSEMRGEEGGFFSATDADSEGQEGKYFVFTADEIQEELGDDAAFFCSLYQIRPEGNYREESTGHPTGQNILHLAAEPESDAERRAAPLRRRLKERRDRRVPPGLDDKRIAGWNALTISGLAVAASSLAEPRFLTAARDSARFVLERMVDSDGGLLRTWKKGSAPIPAFLEDYAYWVLALCDLAGATDGEERQSFRSEARTWVLRLLERFSTPGSPGFFFAEAGSSGLPATGRDYFDKATPSGAAAAVRALLRIALWDGDAGLAQRAHLALSEVSGLMAKVPHGTESWHLALLDWFEFRRLYPEAAARASQESSVGVRYEPQHARLAPVSLEVFLRPSSVRRGERSELGIKIQIDDGFTLAAGDAFQIEAWAGSDITIEGPVLPQSEERAGKRVYAQALELALPLLAAPRAAPGARAVSALVRFRACGEDRCEPERALAVTVPLEVRP